MKIELSSVVNVGTMGSETVLAVNVTYPGESPKRVTFQGMLGVEGGVVFMGDQRVLNAGRFGPFGPQWVRNFFA